MLRKDRIHAHLVKLCNDKKKNQSNDYEIGFSAAKIATDLGLSRNNVSSDLNLLHREGKVIKFDGRPTLYIDMKWAVKNNISTKDRNKLSEKNIKFEGFNGLIGREGSLSQLIKQAQAAVLYPPNGLPILIVGKTGTGKTTFVDNLHRFSISSQIIGNDSPYIVFNCADYANNPQLLISILFGSVKGSYTGSDSDKIGLVEKANGGILFLDEVHRLPPEGQEMLFTLMDSGNFRRLGDTKFSRSKVLIIAATTEEPNSALLSTFHRRFPVVLEMPDLMQRGLDEKFEIIQGFFCNEAERVNKPIKVSRDVLSFLMFYAPKGNIGQLKATIELISSRAYLDYLIYDDDIKILTSHLPQNVIHDVLSSNLETKKKIDTIIGFNDYTFDNIRRDNGSDKDTHLYDFSSKIYEYLDYRNSLYLKEGLNKDIISEKLYKDLEEVFFNYKNGINSIEFKESDLTNFLNLDILFTVRHIAEEVFLRFKYHIKESTIIALAFHINSLFELKKRVGFVDLKEIKSKYSEDYVIAEYIIMRVQNAFNRKIPDMELGFITLILYYSSQEERNSKVGIMVLCHGDGIATGMASLTNEILCCNHVKAIDMHLEDRVSDILEKAIELAKETDEGKGILLFVDMGSLKSFGMEIERLTNIKIVTLDNVSTPALIQATHKALLPYLNLKDIALSVIELNQTLIATSSQEINYKGSKGGVIFAVCSTGEGTATYIKEVIEKNLAKNKITNVSVIEMKISDKEKSREEMKKISNNREIIAVAGSINPGLEGVPFIRLMDFIAGDAQEKIIRYVTKNEFLNIETYECNREMINIMIINNLEENLRYISGKKLMHYLVSYVERIEREKNRVLDNHKYILFMMHLAYCIERLMFNKKESKLTIYKSRVVPDVTNDFFIEFNEEEDRLLEEILEV